MRLATRRRGDIRVGGFMGTALGVTLVLAFLGSASLAGERATSKKAPAPIPVRIDVLPGEAENLVDPAAGGALPVAMFGSAGFDAASVDPGTVVFAQAPVLKTDDGSLGSFEDVNGDGVLDLVVLVD